MGLLLVLLLSVTLQAPFVEAGARMLGSPAQRTIDVTVEVEGSPTTVMARITDATGEIASVAMVPRGGGSYGQVIRLEDWEDVAISFEYISAEGESTTSSASSLSTLGIDVPGASPPVTASPEEDGRGSGLSPWILVAIASVLGALVVAGFWSTGGLGDVVRSRPADWTYAASAGLPDEPPAKPAGPGGDRVVGEDAEHVGNSLDDPVESSKGS
jgi:hypothetical protein